MTVRDLFVSGGCFGTHTTFSIESKWGNIYSGCWEHMPKNIKDKEVVWFDISYDFKTVTISVYRG